VHELFVISQLGGKMKSYGLLSVVTGALLLSGCVVHDHHGRHKPSVGRIVVPAPAVVVPVPVVVKSDAKHCPPGQAKKGKC
jgi:hypothetical protein